MCSFFCCLARDSEETDVDSDTRNVISPFRSSSQTAQDGCCCYRFFMSSCSGREQRKKRYLSKKTPQVCDAAVDTETDFGIVLHDMVKRDSIIYNDCFAEGENFEENLKDHKYASLQFDSKPGKVQYVEGSQVFYVEVRDKKMNQFRRNSVDKSISEEEPDIESDISADILSDTKSESFRRARNESESKTRKKCTDVSNHGIIYMSSKWSPATSMDSLTDKKNLNRSYLQNIEETHENSRCYTLPENDPSTDSKDGYNIDGGHFSLKMITPDNDEVQTLQSDGRSETSSSANSLLTCIYVSSEQAEPQKKMQEYAESEFADVSSQSAQDTRSQSDQGISSPMITESSESANQNMVPQGLFKESLFTLTPMSKQLTEDPSGLLLMDRTNSMMQVSKQDNSVRESNSCPDISIRSEHSSMVLGISRENSDVAESLNTESGLLSVETQTELLDEVDISEIVIPRTPRNSVNSVYTETDFDISEEVPKKETEKAGSGAENSDNNPSSSNTESLSSSDTEGDSLFCDSDSSSSCGRRRKKKTTSNSSESTCSSCSSSTKSVRQLDSKPYKHKSKGHRRKCRSSSSSLAGSSCSSSSNSTISSSSSSTSSSSLSSNTEGLSLFLPKGNG